MCFFFKQKTAYEMRVSDWSSDVCSSDLHIALKKEIFNLHQITLKNEEWYKDETFILGLQKLQKEMLERIQLETDTILPKFVERFIDVAMSAEERKSVVYGKSVSVRVDLGGGGIITKKKNTITKEQ